MSEPNPQEFEKAGAEEANLSFFAEFWEFLKYNKKWWLLPIVLVLILLGVVLVVGGQVPFIYTLF